MAARVQEREVAEEPEPAAQERERAAQERAPAPAPEAEPWEVPRAVRRKCPERSLATHRCECSQ